MGNINLQSGELNRRDFLRLSGRGALVAGATPLLASLIAACGGDTAATTTIGQTPTTAGAPQLETPVIGLSASIQPSYIVAMAGPVLYGADFGLDLTREDFVSFDSHSTVVQAALAGDVGIVGASTLAHLAVIGQGQPFKIFAPFNHADDFVIAARGDVTSIDQLLDPNVQVGMDDLGGAAQAIFDAMLIAEDAGFLATEIPDANIIGSSGGRTSALASGEIDATVIHIYQADQVDAETGDVNILSNLYQNVPVYMMQAYAAPSEWIDANLDAAAAFTASIIHASRELKTSFDVYADAVNELIEEPPDEETLQTLWDLAVEFDFWPSEGGLEEDRMQFMIDLGEQEGAIEPGLTPADVLDTRARDMALDMLP